MMMMMCELEGEDVYSMFHIMSKNPIEVELQVNGQYLTIEVDTGASTTVIGETSLRHINKDNQLEVWSSIKKLRTSVWPRLLYSSGGLVLCTRELQ